MSNIKSNYQQKERVPLIHSPILKNLVNKETSKTNRRPKYVMDIPPHGVGKKHHLPPEITAT